jgi:hypothetical protein
MTDTPINVAGIEIPSSDPVFLAVVGVHVLLGIVCTITGIVAMLSVKRSGRHPRSVRSISGVCAEYPQQRLV